MCHCVTGTRVVRRFIIEENFTELHPKARIICRFQQLKAVARARQRQGRPAEAVGLEKEALAMRRRLFKGDHRDVSESLMALGGILSSMERSEEAEPVLRFNRCFDNLLAGIGARDHARPAILNNECFKNGELSSALLNDSRNSIEVSATLFA